MTSIGEAHGIDGFAELTLLARDPQALASFYTQVVGLELLDPQEDRIWLKVGGRARLGLWSPGVKEFGDQGGAHVHFAFSVRPGGIDALRSRVAEHDPRARVVEHDGGDRSLYFFDPEGNRVEAWDFFRRPERGEEGVEDLA